MKDKQFEKPNLQNPPDSNIVRTFLRLWHNLGRKTQVLPITHMKLTIWTFFCVLTLSTVGCAGEKAITSQGLKHIEIGSDMPEPDNRQFRSVSFRDTLIQEGGYEWTARILEYQDGEVWVESDFFGDNLVNRLRIESPSLQVKGKGKLRVGSTAAELKALHPRWQASWLEEYGYYDVIDPQQIQIHYLFPAPEDAHHDPGIGELADTARVEVIVVM